MMTATLTPPASAVARFDPKDRMDDYLQALSYYLALPASAIDRILFVDNSASDVAPLVELAEQDSHNKVVEIMSFQGNDHPPEYGKAYGEFKLMDYGLLHSSLFKPDDIIWKTTGRLKFINLPTMIDRSAREPFDMLCDLHNVPWVGSARWSNHEHMDLRVFAFRLRAYNLILRGLWERYPGNLDARVLYHRVLEYQNSHLILPRFPVQAKLQGISGRHQHDYSGFRQKTKDMIRGVIRQVMPRFWL